MEMTRLLKLAEQCEQALGPDRSIDEEIMYATQFIIVDNPKPYTSSLDAAMTLVPEGWHIRSLYEMMRGWHVSLQRGFAPGPTSADRAHSHAGRSLALALCAAALRARAVDGDK